MTGSVAAGKRQITQINFAACCGLLLNCQRFYAAYNEKTQFDASTILVEMVMLRGLACFLTCYVDNFSTEFENPTANHYRIIYGTLNLAAVLLHMTIIRLSTVYMGPRASSLFSDYCVSDLLISTERIADLLCVSPSKSGSNV